MTDIKAHILIFSGLNSCIKIMLENVSTNEYYLIFRGNIPKKTWRKGMQADT